MEMQQIRYFIALAQTLNFTQAAEQCAVTQPALTRSIQALETELGGDLIRRERRQTHLTELGRRMLPLMQQCYESAVAARALALDVKSTKVITLSLLVSQTVNVEILVPMFREILRAFPGVQFKIKRSAGLDIGDLLKSGGFDLAVAGPVDIDWDRIESWPLFSENMEVVLTDDPGQGGDEPVALGQMATEKLIFLLGCDMSKNIHDLICRHAAPVKPGHEADSFSDLFALIEANGGIAIVGASAPLRQGLKRAKLAECLTRTVSVYSVAGRQRTAAAVALINLLRSVEWPNYMLSEAAGA